MNRDPVEIDDAGRLFISGLIEKWEPVHERGVTVVVDLEGDIDHGVPTVADQFLYIYLPIHDDHKLPNLDRLGAVAQLCARLIAQEHRVLIHCGMGLNRSALLAGLTLVELGMEADQAIERLRQRQPGSLFNKIFADYLQQQRPSRVGC